MELGNFERQRLDSFVDGLTFRSILGGISNPTSLLTIITVLTTGLYLLVPSIRDFINEQVVDDFIENDDIKGLRDYLDAANLAATAVGLVIPGGILLKAGWVILGNLGVEVGEEVYDYTKDALEDQIVQPGIMQRFFVDLLFLKNRLRKDTAINPNFNLRDFRVF